MPNIEISKIKARRGTNEQRKLVSLDQGEFAYTLDTKRLFIGNGVTLGGDVVGNKIHPSLVSTSSLSNLNAEVGDIVPINNFFYKLIDVDYTNLANWEKLRFSVDPVLFSFNNNDQLNINTNSIDVNYLKTSTITNGIKIDGGLLQLDFQTKSFELSSSKLSLKASGIDERELKDTTFTNGLTGGNGNKVGINGNPSYIKFDIDKQMYFEGYNPFTLRFSDLNSNWFSGGLYYNSSLSSLSASLASVDGISIIRNTDGSIKINDDVTPSTQILSKTTIDEFGRVTESRTSIVSALTGNSTTNGTNSLSSIFNGSLVGNIPGLALTTFTAVSSNGSTLSLSSAGFLTFEGPTSTQEGQTIGRFAIPIFKY